MTSYDTITYALDEHGVATVTIDRPDALNAFNGKMREEFRELWRAMRTDNDVKVIVLTGSGDKAFCVGIDRDEPFSALDENSSLFGTSNNFMYDDPGDDLGPKSNDLWKPVIGAINAMACGGAFYFIAECDVLIASEKATFFDPHVTYGMAAVYEPIKMLRHMPFGEVMRMTLTGNAERISAETAQRIGLVTEVVPHDELADAANRLAQSIAASPATAVQASLRAVWAGADLGGPAALSNAPAIYAAGFDPAALAEGAESFSSGARIKPRTR